MKQRTIAPHLELAELEQRYRQSNDGVARSQWQIICLLAQGFSTQQVVQATSYFAAWIRTIARRYNADGPDGIGDRCHANPGATALLSPEHLAELDAALQQAAPDGGFSKANTLPLVARQAGNEK